ncbi:MAG: hypothetical protein KDC95_18790 [Planctomycetes bacterium]|nr:hypothetical protein [Planctomycetota bacterium]
MYRSAVAISTFAVLASALAAQGTTYAPSYALSQVNSNNIYPHRTTSMRYQQIHDAWSFTSQTQSIIRGVAFRPSNQSNYVNQPAGIVEIQIEMGLAATGVDAQNGSLNMDSNFDSTSRKVVLSRKKVNYPASGATPDDLKVFQNKFAFDASGIFLFNPVLNRSLVIELRQYSYSGGYAWDFVSSTTVAGNGFSVQNGTYDGCPSKGNNVPTFEGDGASLKIAGTATFTGTYDASSIPAVMSLGAQAVSAQLPGTKCMIVNDLGFLIGGATNASNQFQVSFPVPNNPALADVRFYTQMFFLEAGANPVGIVSSRGLFNGVGRGSAWTTMGLARIYGRGDPDALTTAQSNFKNGLVIAFN